MLTRDSRWMVAVIALGAALAGCNDNKGTAAPTSAAPATTTVAPPVTTTAAPATTTAAAPTATAPAKTYDCGAKGQKMCPMQSWMKSEMANASSSGDSDKLAKALTYVAAHAPPGYPQWVTYANEGAAKAKKGDVDGAKASCKACHDAYKEDYKRTQRDRAF